MEFQYIHLDELTRLCKGDQVKFLKYLQQFQTLVSQSLEKISTFMAQKNIEQVSREVHFVLPQLIYFGVEAFSGLPQGPFVHQDANRYLNAVSTDISIVQKALQEIAVLVDELTNNEAQ